VVTRTGTRQQLEGAFIGHRPPSLAKSPAGCAIWRATAFQGV
jgi:hypothetical protein